MPKVSVIIPNYNHAPFLKQRIESVLHQTCQDFEVIILDDLSTDGSQEIIEQYRNHPKVSCIVFNEFNSGSTFKQWQKGIQLTKGDWIWIAESDDWCEPTLLENLVNGLERKTVLSFCQSLMFQDSGEIIWNSSADFFEEQIDGKYFVNQKMLINNAIINASMCIFSKDAFSNIKPDFVNYKFCGDWLFWIDIATQGNVFVSAKILNYFRKHGRDVSKNAYSQGTLYTEYFKLVDNILKKNIINENVKNKLLVEKYKEFIYDNRIDSEVRKELKKEFYKKVFKTNYFTILRANASFTKLRLKDKLLTSVKYLKEINKVK